jgi:hypothetical protein
MSYNTKYRITYKRRNGGNTTINIGTSGYAGSVIDLIGDENPLTINVGGSVDNIYSPTIGTGATIKVLAEPLSLLELFTNEPQKFNVQCLHEDVLFWQGFVNCNIYQEDYSSTQLVPIQIQCNDGMSVLDNMYYKGSDGSIYTGTTTIGTVLNNILSNLGITFNNVYTSHGLTTNGYTSNLFTQLKVNQLNYLDEQTQPMTARQVLNSVFGGLSLVMKFKGSDIYIIDPIDLSNSTLGKVYTLPDFTESSATIGGIIDLSGTTLEYYETGQNLDIIPASGEVQIKYNPYNIESFKYDFNDSKNMTTAGSFYPITTPSPNNYYKNSSVVFKNWTQSGGSHFMGLKEKIDEDPTFVLYIDNSGDVLTYDIPYSNINTDSIVSMKITFDSYCQTRINDGSGGNSQCGENLFSSIDPKTPVYGYYIQYSIKVGDQYLKGNVWEAGETGNYKSVMAVRDFNISDSVYVANNSTSQVGDSWWPVKPILIPLSSSLIGGEISFSLYNTLTSSMINYNNTKPWFVVGAAYRKLLIKNLKIEFVDSHGKAIDNSGVLLKGNLSTNVLYKNNPTQISTTSGTGPYGISRGGYLSVDNQSIINYGIYRSGNSSARNTEDLVLQSYISQYKVPRLKLSVNLDVKNYLTSIDNYLIMDNKYLTGKCFFIASGQYIDDEENFSAEMIEITNTRETF